MSTKEEVLEKLKKSIEELDEDLGTEAAKEAVELKMDPIEAISQGLGAGMQTQSDLFDEGEVFVPQLVVAADIFEQCVGIITADLSEEAKSATSLGKVLMTTTMPAQREIIELLKEDGIRDQFKCMFGGAPVSPEWIKEIGADAYAENAAEAVEQAKKLMAM